MIVFFLVLFGVSIYELVVAGLGGNPIKIGALFFCTSTSLLFAWRAYLSTGDNRQRAQNWLRSDGRSKRVFRIVMVILSFAVFGHIIVDIGQ
jgi:nicotinamide riboside transporter PnuC